MKPTHQESLQYTDIGNGMGGAVLWMSLRGDASLVRMTMRAWFTRYERRTKEEPE